MSSNASNQQPRPRISADTRVVSALISEVLRNSFPQRSPHTPKQCYTGDWSYMYYHDTASLKLNNSTNGEIPMVWSKRMFDQIVVPAKYDYKWLQLKKGTKDVYEDPKLQVDHAMDLRHIIRLTFGDVTDGAKIWDITPYGAYLHLSFFLNDARNAWMLPGPLNNVKGQISTANWDAKRTLFKGNKEEYTKVADAEKNFIMQYLFGLSDGEGRTPFSELMSLSTEMAGLPPSDLTQLTIMAGKAMLSCMEGWANFVKISSYAAVMAKAKDSQMGIQDLEGRFSEKQKERRDKLQQNAQKGVGLFSKYFDIIEKTNNAIKEDQMMIDESVGHFENVLKATYLTVEQTDSMDTT